MTLKIIHKNNTSAGQAPASGDLDIGEIAVNSADAKLYTKDNSGAVQEFISKFEQTGSGAVKRTVESRLQDVVSVKDFGAVGDGVTDDTAAIQAAINYAETITKTNTYSGKHFSIFFPDGIYEVTNGITVSGNGIALCGNSKGAVLQVTGTAATTALTVDDAWDTVISGLAFQANNASGTVNSVNSKGIVAESPKRLNIIGCDFYNLNSSLEIIGSYQTIISDCRFNQNTRSTAPSEQSIYIIGASGNTVPGGGIHIDNCEFTGSNTVPTTNHINVVSVDGLYITNCHLVKYARGLRIAPTPNDPNKKTFDIMVSNTYFDECTSDGYGVIFAGNFADNGFINGTQFSNCYFRTGRNSVYIATEKSTSDTAVIQGLLFTGCKFQQAQRSAVLGPSDKARVQGLKFTGCFFKGNNAENDPLYSPIAVLQPNCTMSVVGNTFGIESNPVDDLWRADASTKIVNSGNDAFTSTGTQPVFALTLTVSNLTGQTSSASAWSYDGAQVTFRLPAIVSKTVTADGTIDFGTLPEYLRPADVHYFSVTGKYNDGSDKSGTMTFAVKPDGTMSLQSLATEGIFSAFTAGDVVQTVPMSGAYAAALKA